VSGESTAFLYSIDCLVIYQLTSQSFIESFLAKKQKERK
jgi:hypothetical protein